jgi:hypothetical protein
VAVNGSVAAGLTPLPDGELLSHFGAALFLRSDVGKPVTRNDRRDGSPTERKPFRKPFNNGTLQLQSRVRS